MKEKGDGKKNDQKNTAAIIDSDLGIVYNESLVNLTCHINDWVIDLGASSHVTAHRDYFTSYVNGDYYHVRMGNEGASKIVRHIPDICLNLISTGKLDDDGYINQFGEGKWKLTKGSLVLTMGRKVSILYMMKPRSRKKK